MPQRVRQNVDLLRKTSFSETRSPRGVALRVRSPAGHSSARATSAKAMRPTTPVSRTRTTYRNMPKGMLRSDQHNRKI